MLPRQKYVPLSEGKTLVRPEQKGWADRYAELHGISLNQLTRDVFQHAINCPFFNGRGSIPGTVASPQEDSI